MMNFGIGSVEFSFLIIKWQLFLNLLFGKVHIGEQITFGKANDLK